MAIIETVLLLHSIPPTSALMQRRCYATYTLPRHEKLVSQPLAQKWIIYLPLYESIHRWKDRRAPVKLPLFPGVRIWSDSTERTAKVLEIDPYLAVGKRVRVNAGPRARSGREAKSSGTCWTTFKSAFPCGLPMSRQSIAGPACRTGGDASLRGMSNREISAS
jgi:hypothetical protein